MIPMTTAQICEAVQGTLFGDEYTTVTEISSVDASLFSMWYNI